MLRQLIPYLAANAKQELLRIGFESLPNFDSDASFTWGFEIAPLLNPDSGQGATEEARSISSPRLRAEVYANLAPMLCGRDRQRLLKETLKLLKDCSAADRLEGFGAWVSHTEGQTKRELLRGILNAVHELVPLALKDDELSGTLAAALNRVLPEVSDDLIESAVSLVLAPKLSAYQNEMLNLLAPKLSGDLLGHVLGGPRDFEDHESRAAAMGALAIRLDGYAREEALRSALCAALRIRKPYRRARALAKLSPALEDLDKERALRAGLLAAKNCFQGLGVLALRYLAPQLTGGLISEGVEIASELHGDSVEALAIMTPRLNAGIKQEKIRSILNELEQIDDQRKRGHILENLAPILESDSLCQGWLAARQLSDNAAKAKALAAIAPRLSGCEREEALKEAQEAALTLTPYPEVAAMVIVGSQLVGEARSKAIARARKAIAKMRAEDRAQALCDVMPFLGEPERQEAIQEALECFQELEAWQQKHTLESLAVHLSGDLLEKAVAITENITDPEQRAGALGSVAGRLAQETKEIDSRVATLRRIGFWLWSFRGISRAHLLHFCTKSLFEREILSQECLGLIIRSLRQIFEEWRFEPPAASKVTKQASARPLA